MSAALSLTPSLYERFDELAMIVGQLEQLDEQQYSGVIVSEELRAALVEELHEAIRGTREKVDRTANVLGSFEAIERYADDEIERIQKRKARIAAQREKLEGYVIGALTAAGVSSFDGHTSTLTVRKNPLSVAIVAPDEIPADYMRQPPTPKAPPPAPDKELIKQALKAKLHVPGCRLQQTLKLVRS